MKGICRDAEVTSYWLISCRSVQRLSEWQPNRDERVWLREGGVHGYRGVKQGSPDKAVSPNKSGLSYSSTVHALGGWFSGKSESPDSSKRASPSKPPQNSNSKSLMGSQGLGGWFSGFAGGAGPEKRNARLVGGAGLGSNEPFWQLTRMEVTEMTVMATGGRHHPYV